MGNQTVAATYPDLAGKVALVTGGSGGIGAATCRALAANGVRVAVNGRRVEPIETLVGAITREGGDAIGVSGDCSDPDAVDALVAQTQRDLGPIDVVCAFAGGGRPPQPITTQLGRLRHRAVLPVGAHGPQARRQDHPPTVRSSNFSGVATARTVATGGAET